jgi:hypothetical protein
MTFDEGELRALLDEAAHIEDEGFTDRVMRALPPPRRAAVARPVRIVAPVRWQYLTISFASLLGCATAYAATGGGRPLERTVHELFAGHFGVVALTAAGLLAMTAMIAMATSSD